MEIRRVFYSGNSTYVAIPPKFLVALDVQRKDYLIVTIEKGCIILRPLRNRLSAEEQILGGEEKNKIIPGGSNESRSGTVIC